MKVLYLFIFTIILAITGCSSDTMTGVDQDGLLIDSFNLNGSQKTVKMVPFKGHGSGLGYVDTDRTDCPEGTVPFSGEATGVFTHGGKSSVSFSHCSYFILDPENLTYTDGIVEIKTANGDMIYSEYTGLLTGPDTFINSNTIIGGTGRFDDVSGSYIEEGSFNFIDEETFEFDIYLDGEISSVGSNK